MMQHRGVRTRKPRTWLRPKNNNPTLTHGTTQNHPSLLFLLPQFIHFFIYSSFLHSLTKKWPTLTTQLLSSSSFTTTSAPCTMRCQLITHSLLSPHMLFFYQIPNLIDCSILAGTCQSTIPSASSPEATFSLRHHPQTCHHLL